jgi:DNA-binding response OmpR family regulator
MTASKSAPAFTEKSMNRPLLIVDDDVDQLMAVTRWFIQRGYHPVSVTHPRQALEAASYQRFPVALLDASLPQMDGLELMHRLKRMQDGVQVVILSDCEYPDQRTKAADSFAWLVKPCELELLEAIIQPAFERTAFESPARQPSLTEKVSVETQH